MTNNKKKTVGAAAPAGPDEVAVLLPEATVGGFIIKPWPFGHFKKVLTPLVGLIQPLKEMGLTVDNAERFFIENGLDIILLLPDGLAALTTIIAVTLGISEEEVDAIDPDQIMVIGTTIFAQNIERLKNSWPLIMTQLKSMVRAT